MSTNRLTKQQIQLIQLIARGLSNKQIAEELCLAEGSVRGYIAAIYRIFKFDMRDPNARVKLTLWAMKHGFVKVELEPEEPVSLEKVQYKYKYKRGDRVYVTNHVYNRVEGEIVALMPWTLVFPGYDVRIDGVVVAVSERSILKERGKNGEV